MKEFSKNGSDLRNEKVLFTRDSCVRSHPYYTLLLLRSDRRQFEREYGSPPTQTNSVTSIALSYDFLCSLRTEGVYRGRGGAGTPGLRTLRVWWGQRWPSKSTLEFEVDGGLFEDCKGVLHQERVRRGGVTHRRDRNGQRVPF